MATASCTMCIYSYTRGGVTYCGCPGSPLKDKSVSSGEKSCNYFKPYKSR